jgi:hypothetical protein
VGRWLIDGVSLSSMAMNVRNRSAGLARAGRRGDNQVVSGQDGSSFVRNKPLAEGTVGFQMWVQGCLPDGTMPTQQSRQMVLRQNLEGLLSLVSDPSDLQEVTRIESAGYGAQNVFTNPRCASGTPALLGYRNWVSNPRQETQETREARRNLLPDPEFTARTSQLYAVNCVPDPQNRQYRSATKTAVAGNWWGMSNFEAAQGFTAGTAWSSWVEAAGVTGRVQPVTVTPVLGTQAFVLTATAALAANASLGRRTPATIPAGASMSFRCKIRRWAAGTTTRQVQARMLWFTGATQTGASGWGPVVTLPTSVSWVDLEIPVNVAGVAPTAAASVELRTVTGMAVGEGVAIDRVAMVDGAGIDTVAAPFFDGDSTWGEWGSSPGRSIAYTYANVNPNWTLTGTRAAFHAYACSLPFDAAGTSLGFVAHRHTPSGVQQFLRPCVGVEAGRPVMLKFRARALSGTSCTVELCSTVGGTVTSRASATVVGQATAARWETTNGQSGSTSEYVTGSYTPAPGEGLAIRVTVPVQATGDLVLTLTDHAVTDFYGIRVADSPAADAAAGVTYAWDGTVGNSRTLIYAPVTSSLTSRNRVYVQTPTNSRADLYVRSAGEAVAASWPAVDVTDQVVATGFSATVRCFAYNMFSSNQAVTPPTVRMRVRAVDGNGVQVAEWLGATTTLTVGTVVATAGATVAVGVGALAVPSSAVQLLMSLELVGPAQSQYVCVLQPMFADHYGAVTAAWFDGNAGGVWTGTPNASPSALTAAAPAGYTVEVGTLELPVAGQTTLTFESVLAANPQAGVRVGGQPPGGYRFGVEVAATVRSRVWAAGWLNGVQVGERLLGVVAGSNLTLLDRVQTLLTTTGPFDTVRVRFEALDPTPDPARFRVGKSYLFSVAESLAPTVGPNLLTNPTGRVGTTSWSTSTSYPTTVAAGYFGDALRTSGPALSNTVTVPASGNETFYLWGKVMAGGPVALVARWMTGSQPLGSGTVVATSSSRFEPEALSGTVTCPLGATGLQVEFRQTAWTAASPLNVFEAYVAKPASGEDYTSALDPAQWLYFDGDSDGDYQGTPVQWDAEVDASPSVTTPLSPDGWDRTGLVVLRAPTYRPPGSVGNVVAFPGFANPAAPVQLGSGQFSGFSFGFSPPPDGGFLPTAAQSMTGRTIPVQVSSPYVSGQVALARRLASSQVTVRVWGCDNRQGDNPTVVFQQQMRTLAETVTWRDCGVGKPFVFVEVEYVESEPNPTFAVLVDNVAIVPSDDRLGVDYPGYFDGASPAAVWLGLPDASESQNYAGARRCYVEFAEPIIPTSMAAGTRVELELNGRNPRGVWEDLIESTWTVTTSSPDAEFSVDGLTGASARDSEATVEVSLLDGVAPTAFSLTDAKSGSWVQVAQQLTVGDVIRIGGTGLARTVTLVAGDDGEETSLAAQMYRGGSSRLLPLTPYSTTSPPRLLLDCAAEFAGTLQITVTSRRKYLIA